MKYELAMAFGLTSLLVVDRAQAVDSPWNETCEPTTAAQKEYCNSIGFEGEIWPTTCPPTIGGPFHCSPACVDGVSTEPLKCLEEYGSIPDSGYPEGQVLTEPCWNTPEDECPFDVVGKYFSCGGPIWPAVIDDEDNLYFWTARGRLHSVDKRGKLRWRLDLCNPGPLYFGDAYPKELPMVMDYHGTLYFFAGDELYGVRGSDGKVLLQRRVIIPGIRPDPREPAEVLSISEGEVVTNGNYQEYGLVPVLDSNGMIYAGFVISSLMGEAKGRATGCGFLRMSRMGEVMTHSFVASTYCDSTSLIGGTSNSVWGVHSEVRRTGGSGICDTDSPATEVGLISENTGREWASVDTYGFSPNAMVAKDGTVYSATYMALSRFRKGQDGRNLTTIASQDNDESVINAFNRPVMDRDGFIYVTRDQGYNTGVGLIALDPVKIEAEVTDPEAYLLTMPNAPGYLWGLKVPYPALNATTPVIAKSGILYTALGGSLLALQLKAGGAQPTVTWEYIAPGGLYPTTMHVLSDGTLVIGDDSGWLYFLRDGIDNGGLDTEAAWPRPYHDNYRSNNASHPMKWDRTKPAPYPSLEELLEDARAGWNCNTDKRCYPKKYYETCDWGGRTDWAGHEVSCDSENAVATPCPKETDPRRTVCLATDDLAVHPCDAPQGCNCATPGATSRSNLPWLGLLIMFGAIGTVVRLRKRQ